MATARRPTQTWTARAGTLYMHSPASDITFSSATTLSGSFATKGYELITKNITITPPETGYDKQDFLGKDSSNFQNQLLDEKPVGISTITGTMVLGEDETIENIISGTFASAPTGYSRYQLGTNNTSANEVAAAVVLMNNDFTKIVSFAFDNGKFTKWGDVRISGPDAHWEQDFTIICLAKDFYYEFKN